MNEATSTEFMLEEIDPTSHKVREVYALYGLCMYISQGLERVMNLLMSSGFQRMPAAMTQQMYDQRVEIGFKRTFGGTVSEWSNNEQDASLRERLRAAVDCRNWLAHRYFWERAGHLNLDSGLDYMLSELTEIRGEFQSIDDYFCAVLLEHNAKLGIQSEALDDIREEILREAQENLGR
jgi:hypothetical protein